MTMMMYASVITGINLLILLVLLAIYVQNYRQIRASFSLGLIIFALVFLIQKLVTMYLFVFTMFDYPSDVGGYMFILEIIQTIAFSVLLWITLK